MLFYGDNLDILRRYVPDESIDLVYLDPPFNSKADYNILFRETSGEKSHAQIQAFTDFWHWDREARHAYDYLVRDSPNENLSKLSEAIFNFLGKNDMTAYLVMMAIRLEQLQRVLKDTGALFLHCDPTASHYLKLILDAVFGARNFRNELIWKRTFAHSSAKKWGDVHDTILFYTKGDNYTWTGFSLPHQSSYIDDHYYLKDAKGNYQYVVLTGPGTTSGDSGKQWRGYDPSLIGRHWAVPQKALTQLKAEGIPIPENLQSQLELLYNHGLIKFTRKKNGKLGSPRFKLYRPQQGIPLQDVIIDVPPVNSQAQERLGYPTQKPSALLERLINACSHEGDWVLDPFCGCGTAIAAAEKLNRHWVGIDVTFLAINVIKNRLKGQFPNCKFNVEGEPKDLSGARQLAQNRYQFQYWALSLIGARPYGSKA